MGAEGKEGQNLLPILLACDINVYSMARAFHEAYGIKPLVLCRQINGIFKHSKIATVQIVDNLDQPEVFRATMDRMAEEHKDKTLILIGCADHYVRLVVANKEYLKDRFVLPYADQDVMDNIILKETFYNLCSKYDLDYAKTFVFKQGMDYDFDIPFDFPVVLKPSCSVSYNAHHFEGQHKVYFINDIQTLRDTVKEIYSHGYDDSMIIQDMIPGKDASIYDLQMYVGSDHKMKLMNMGNVLLEEHTPKGIGSNAATIVDCHEEIMQKVRTLLEGIGYEGLADCDMKFDERDGKFKIFEINIRQGRSHYRVTGGGDNLAKYIVDDYVYHKPMELKIVREPFFWHVIPLGIVYKYVKDPKRVAQVKQLVKEGKSCHSLYYSKDNNLIRTLTLKAKDFNQFRKYKRYLGDQ